MSEFSEKTGANSGERRLLLVSYHFGEDGPTGGFRWSAMANDLIAKGWVIDVITTAAAPRTARHGLSVYPVRPPQWPERWIASLSWPIRQMRRRNGQQPATEPAPVQEDPVDLLRRLETLSDERPVGKAAIKRKLSLVVNESAGFSHNVSWSLGAIRVGRSLLGQNRYAAIVVSTPPHATQLVGWSLSRSSGVPYIADFRDPWRVGVHEFDSDDWNLLYWFERRLERLTQKQCRVAVHNTEVAAQRIRQQKWTPAIPRTSIANGYDAEPTDVLPDREKFRIVFSGWIYPFMDPRGLLRAVATFRESDPRVHRDMRLELVGVPDHYHGIPFADIVRAYGLDDCTTISGRVPRSEVLHVQQRAAVLVAFDYPHPLCVVMKFYDYLLARGDMLLLGAPDSALDQAAQQVGKHVIHPGDASEITAFLRTCYDRWVRDDYGTVNDPLGTFRRSGRSDEFHALLMDVVDNRDPRTDEPDLLRVSGGTN